MASNVRNIEWSRYSIFIILLVVFVAASFLSPNFLSFDNLLNVLRQAAVITILAYGAMTLIIGGMIDLSAGAVMAFAGVVSVMAYKSTNSLLVAILAGMVIGVACNLVNAFVVASLRTPAFIVTLGMMLIARGAVLQLTQGQNILQLGDFILIGQGNLSGILPIPILVLILITVIIWYLMNQTRYGSNIHDVSLTLLYHVRIRGSRTVDHAEQIDADSIVPMFQIHVSYFAENDNARIVELVSPTGRMCRRCCQFFLSRLLLPRRLVPSHKIGRQRGKSVGLTIRPAVFNRDVPAVDVASFI